MANFSLPASSSIQPFSAWLQPDCSNAVGIAWVTRVLQPDAEAHKSDCASHCMGYFIQQHKNMCAHTDMLNGCFLKCIYSWNVPQVPVGALVRLPAGFTGTPSVWRRGSVCAGGGRRDGATGDRRGAMQVCCSFHTLDVESWHNNTAQDSGSFKWNEYIKEKNNSVKSVIINQNFRTFLCFRWWCLAE